VFAVFCLLGGVCTAPHALAEWRHPTLEAWLTLLLIGFLAVVAQILMTHALGAVEAATTGIINELAVVTAIVLGTFIDAEPLPPIAGVGAVITLVGVAWAAHISTRAERP
jgi:drug/metabolite transporter (DMT)-like permease